MIVFFGFGVGNGKFVGNVFVLVEVVGEFFWVKMVLMWVSWYLNDVIVVVDYLKSVL